MKTVNLEEILDEHCTTTYNKYNGEEEIISSKEAVLIAMREACNKAIELAAFTTDNIYDNNGTAYISREIILNTKSQII